MANLLHWFGIAALIIVGILLVLYLIASGFVLYAYNQQSQEGG